MLTYDFYVFDCDGVILDSNRIKTDAFRYALREEDEQLIEELVNYHMANGGITRHEKFAYFYTNIKPTDDKTKSKKVEQALADFADFCEKELFEADIVRGFEAFIKKLDKPCFVVTGGKEDEVKDIFRHKDIAKHFELILGNPVSKRDNMQRLKDSLKLEGKGIFFGDAWLDYKLSDEFGLDFVFIKNYSEWKDGLRFCKENNLTITDDFSTLLNDH